MMLLLIIQLLILQTFGCSVSGKSYDFSVAAKSYNGIDAGLTNNQYVPLSRVDLVLQSSDGSNFVIYYMTDDDYQRVKNGQSAENAISIGSGSSYYCLQNEGPYKNTYYLVFYCENSFEICSISGSLSVYQDPSQANQIIDHNQTTQTDNILYYILYAVGGILVCYIGYKTPEWCCKKKEKNSSPSQGLYKPLV